MYSAWWFNTPVYTKNYAGIIDAGLIHGPVLFSICTWAIVALSFENRNYFSSLWRAFREYYNHKSMVKFIPWNMWEYVHLMYLRLIHLASKNLAATKLTVLSQKLCCKQHRTVNASFRFHRLIYLTFLLNPWDVVMRMHRRKIWRSLYVRGKSLLAPNCSTSCKFKIYVLIL